MSNIVNICAMAILAIFLLFISAVSFAVRIALFGAIRIACVVADKFFPERDEEEEYLQRWDHFVGLTSSARAKLIADTHSVCFQNIFRNYVRKPLVCGLQTICTAIFSAVTFCLANAYTLAYSISTQSTAKFFKVLQRICQDEEEERPRWPVFVSRYEQSRFMETNPIDYRVPFPQPSKSSAFCSRGSLGIISYFFSSVRSSLAGSATPFPDPYERSHWFSEQHRIVTMEAYARAEAKKNAMEDAPRHHVAFKPCSMSSRSAQPVWHSRR